MNYLNIEQVPSGLEYRVKQDLKFKTGRFTWKVAFNNALDPSSVNNSSVYVTNTAQRPVVCNIFYDSTKKSIEIEPLEPYAENESYILHITPKVRSRGGKNLRNEVTLQFKL